MAFWGAVVPKGGTYKLRFDGDHNRLRITQAMLADYSGEYWAMISSKLQCTTGSNPPVYICELTKYTTCRSLKLEFEKSDEVVFTAKGPQGFHLSGYYVSSGRAAYKDKTKSLNDPNIICSNEVNKVVAENAEVKRLMAKEDAGNVGSIEQADGLIFRSSDQLVNTQMHQDGDANMTNEQPDGVCVSESKLEEDVCEDCVSCIRKTSIIENNPELKVGNDADKVTLEPSTTVKDIMTLAGILEVNFDSIRKGNQQDSILLPPHEVDLEKKASEHIFGKDASNCNTNAISVEVLEIEKNNLNQSILQNSFPNDEEQAQKCSKDAGEVRGLNHELQNVSHSEVQKQKTLSDKIDPYLGEVNCENFIKEDKLMQGIEGNEDVSIIQPQKARDQKRTAELDEKEKTSKKKQKSEAEDNSDAIPRGTRTLSNGMRIEYMSFGETNGIKATPGRTVKIFFTIKLKDTETLAVTNVGGGSSKFRLGSKRIIDGLNIGIDGMCVGDRRRLLIPPELGHGKISKNGIPPNSWMILEVDVVSVRIGKKERN